MSATHTLTKALDEADDTRPAPFRWNFHSTQIVTRRKVGEGGWDRENGGNERDLWRLGSSTATDKSLTNRSDSLKVMSEK